MQIEAAMKEDEEKKNEEKEIEKARKIMKSELFDRLIKFADLLDQKGLSEEATAIDQYLDSFCPDCQSQSKGV